MEITKEDALAIVEIPVHENEAPRRMLPPSLSPLRAGVLMGIPAGELLVVVTRRTGKSIFQQGPLNEEEQGRMIELQQARDCTQCENATPQAWAAANPADARELSSLELRDAIFKQIRFVRG